MESAEKLRDTIYSYRDLQSLAKRITRYALAKFLLGEEEFSAENHGLFEDVVSLTLLDDGDKNVQDQSCGLDRGRCDSQQGHRCDVT